MLRYLLPYLVAPLLRRVLAVLLILTVLAVAVTIPARLWMQYVDPRPSGQTIIALNVATFVCLLGIVVARRVRRWRRMHR